MQGMSDLRTIHLRVHIHTPAGRYFIMSGIDTSNHENQLGDNGVDSCTGASPGSVVWNGIRAVLKHSFYLFSLFSMWFTLRAAVCGYLEEETLTVLENGETAFIRGTQCQDHLREILLTASTFVPYKELGEVTTAVAFVAGVYWLRFWAVEAFRLELPEAAAPYEKPLMFVRALAESTAKQFMDFATYGAVLLMSASMFAVVLCRLCVNARLRGYPGDGPIDTMNNEALVTMMLGELWRLFKIHLASSIVVADALYITGPLLGRYPGENGPVWFVCLSVMLTAFAPWDIFFE